MNTSLGAPSVAMFYIMKGAHGGTPSLRILGAESILLKSY
jgi:hypothetical protein